MSEIEAEYAIVGAGAIGSILGAHLARAGHRVSVLARGARARQLQSEGLRIEGLAGFTVPIAVADDPKRLAAAHTLIIATKTPHTGSTLNSLAHVEVQNVFSIQNGVEKNELLAAAFGRERTLGALADTSGELRPDGVVLFTRNVNLLIGELSGELSPRADAIAKDIDAAGVRCRAVADVVNLEWSKFAAWTGLALMAVVTRAESWKFLEDPDAATLLLRITVEMQTLATAFGIELTDRSVIPVKTLATTNEAGAVELIRAAGAQYRQTAPQHRMSTLQDLQSGRALEIHETVGYALRKGREMNIQMPVLDVLYRAASAIERTGSL